MVFNEDTRVKIPATIQFLRLGYDYQSIKNVDVDFNTKIFRNRFKTSLEKINKRKFSDDEITSILSDIDNVIKNNDLGKEFYNWLINPIDKVKLIDFDNIENNDFAVVDELPFSIEEGTEEETGDYKIGDKIEGYGCRLLAYLEPFNEECDYYPILTDDKDYPVVELVGGRLYRVNVEKLK